MRVLLGHERVLQTGREAGTTSASQARALDFVDDPVLAHAHDVFCLMPVSSLECASDEWVLILVDVGEDTVLIAQVTVEPHGGSVLEQGTRRLHVVP